MSTFNTITKKAKNRQICELRFSFSFNLKCFHELYFCEIMCRVLKENIEIDLH